MQQANYTNDILLLEKKIERLDREWAINREKYRVTTRHSSRLPDENTKGFTAFGLIVGVGFMIFWLSMVGKMSDKTNEPILDFFMLFGVIVLIAVVVRSFVHMGKANDYEDAERRYQNQRVALIKELEALERRAG